MPLRAATVDDMPRVWALIRELADYERLLDQVDGSVELMRAHLRTGFQCQVWEEDGAIIGYCLYFFNFSTFRAKPGLYLEDIYVQPAFRGFGYGREMLRAMAQEAVRLGCARMEWAVLDWNEPAIGFYRKVGADILPDWRICRLTGDALEDFAASRNPRPL